MSELTLQKRAEYVRELDTFTQNKKNELTKIVTQLGWSFESIAGNPDEMVVCPFFSSHRVPLKTLEHHLEICQWKAEGYDLLDKPFSESQKEYNKVSSITFDEALQSKVLHAAKQNDVTLKIGVGEQLIPRTSDRLFSDFTSDERRVLYDYVIKNTAKPDIGNDITDLNKVKKENDSEALSFLEQLAQDRNLKRRRTRHRGVHTNKKSQVEILREVINQQMELYVEYIGIKTEDPMLSELQMKATNVEHKSKKEVEDKSEVKEYENEYWRGEKRKKSKHQHKSRSRSKERKKRRKSRDRHKSRKRSRSPEKKKHKHRKERKRSRS